MTAVIKEETTKQKLGMKNFKAQKLVEWFFEKEIIYGKEIDYKITQRGQKVNRADPVDNLRAGIETVHNLIASIESEVVWFSDTNVLAFLVEDVKDIDIKWEKINIEFVYGNTLEIELMLQK